MTASAPSPTDAAPPDERDDFFVGWLPMPRGYGRFLRPVLLGLLLLTVTTAAALALFQRDPGKGNWDVDNVHTFAGIAYNRPYALIRVPGEGLGDPPRTMLLVEEGKFGALARVGQVVGDRPEGRAVRVTGTILHRGGRSMLELAEGEQGMRPLTDDEVRQLPPLAPPMPELLSERVTLQGEIIDPKCYLGAMKPGGGKTHKACAMLCISGGVPPMLVTRNAGKEETFYLLATAGGEMANELVLPFVGDPAEVTGRLERHGDLLVVRLADAGVRRR